MSLVSTLNLRYDSNLPLMPVIPIRKKAPRILETTLTDYLPVAYCILMFVRSFYIAEAHCHMLLVSTQEPTLSRLGTPTVRVST